jgi:hypothetical protein
MSKSSPITNRIQKALYMRSALKQDGKKDEKKDVTNTGPTIYADSSQGNEQLKGKVVETPAEYAAKQIQKTNKQTYTYDMMRADAIKQGMSEEDADAQVAAARSENIANYGTHSPTAAGKTDNTREVGEVDAEGNPVMIDDPSGEKVMTKEATKEFKGEQDPSSYKRMSQFDVGQAHRARRKAMNTEFRAKKRANKLEDKAKKYAARTGHDMDLQVTDQVLSDNYEMAGNVNQGSVGERHNKTYTNIDDKTNLTTHVVKKDSKGKEIEEKGIGMRSPLQQAGMVKAGVKWLAKTLGKGEKGVVGTAKAIKTGGQNIQKSVSKIVDEAGEAYKVGAGRPTPKPKVVKKITKAEYKKLGTVKGKGRYGLKGSDEGWTKFNKGQTNLGKNVKGGADLSKSGGKTGDKPWRPLGIKKRFSIPIAGAVTGGLIYSKKGGGDDTTTPDPIVKDDDKKTTPTPTPTETDPIIPKKTTTTPVTTGGGGDGSDVIKVTGVDSGTLVEKKAPNVTSTATVSDKLSKSMQRFNERQQKKTDRASNKQKRKDANLASRQKRRVDRRANPSLVGGALRKTFGGKKHNTSINNMGSAASPPGTFNQKDKKGKGAAAGWGSTYSV